MNYFIWLSRKGLNLSLPPYWAVLSLELQENMFAFITPCKRRRL